MNFPEVICLSEVWLKEEELKLAKLVFYKLTDYFCRKDCKGGGTAIYISQFLDYKNKKIKIAKKSEKLFEYSCVDIYIDNLKINITCIYRSPDADLNYFKNNLESFLDNFGSFNGPMWICGDFNVNFMCNTNDSKDITNLFLSYGLKKCFDEYTRIQGQSKTGIDNIFSNIEVSLLNPKIVFTDISDHFSQLVSFEYDTNRTSNDILSKRYFNNDMNITQFKLNLHNSFLAKENFSDFFKEFKQIVDVSFPVVNVQKKCNRNISNKWITPEIVNQGHLLRDLHKELKLKNNSTLLEKYKKLKKDHSTLIRESKKNHYDSLYVNSSNKSETSWKIINSEIQLKQKNASAQFYSNKNHTIITDMQHACSEFNNYFIESVEQLTRNSNIKNCLNNGEGNSVSMFLKPFSQMEIRNIILSVTNKDSAGYDEIPCSLLKVALDYIVEPITYLVNKSFQEGKFPDELKISVIIPILKKGDAHEIVNYRPVALLSVFSKIFEKAFFIRLSSFIDHHNILTSAQFGFRKGHSTEGAINNLYMYILKSLDEKQKSASIFYDFSRAFDTINHDLLLQKLDQYGVRGKPLDWIKSYLAHRQQYVSLYNNNRSYKSEVLDVSTGVPQGSILGPLLFIVFINDLVKNIDCDSATLFADDFSASTSASNNIHLATRLNNCNTNLMEWSENNGLVPNATKTNLMLFSTKKIDYSLLVKMDGMSLQQQTTVKFLGLFIDSNLSWVDQIDTVKNKLASYNYTLFQLRKYVHRNILLNYYFSFVHSTINYGILCWGNSIKMQEIFIQQKKIIRCICFVNSTHSCKNLFKDLNILTVYSVYILACVMFVHKNYSKLPKCKNINHYATRQANDLYIPSCRLELTSRGSYILPLKLYNHLPPSVQSETDFNHFKKKVKKILLVNSFYSVEEYLNCLL